MNVTVPDYYKGFKCIADKCRHSCCIGWDIDIDKDTLKVYDSVKGTLGKRLKESVCYQDGNAFFKLTKNERCPFLNITGLCDIITELGEGALCQICTDHPRFRNFYKNAVEMGLGLCCEEAARLILTQTEPFKIVPFETDDMEEQGFLRLRKTVFDIIQDREFGFFERVENLLDFFGTDMPERDWKREFLALEVLEPEWQQMLNGICNDSCGQDIIYEQLFCYFVFRHLAGGLFDGRYLERIKLAVLGCRVIAAIHKKTGKSIIDIARMFSSEIEYSDENTERLLELLE